MNREEPEADELVAGFLDLIDAGEATYLFYPPDLESGRPPCVLLNFTVWGVGGTLAIEEPEVDPAGFYI